MPVHQPTHPASSKTSCVPAGTVIVPRGFAAVPTPLSVDIKTLLFAGSVTSAPAVVVTPTAAFHETSFELSCGHADDGVGSDGL